MTARGHPATIIVPAHNEAVRGFRSLPTLREASLRGLAVVIVCNGCSDDTANLARQVPDATVEELVIADKSAALNAGDAAAGEGPRIYMDADADIDIDGLLALVAAVSAEGVIAAGPVVRMDTAGAPRLVQVYVRALTTLPFLVAVRSRHLDGRGLYAVSAAGRKRFEHFPALRADDTFFDRMFDPAERRVVEGAVVVLRPPASFRGFLRARVRSAQGAREVSAWLAANRPDAAAPAADDVSSLTAPWRQRLAAYRRLGLLDGWNVASIAALATFAVVEMLSRSCAASLALLGRRATWR